MYPTLELFLPFWGWVVFGGWDVVRVVVWVGRRGHEWVYEKEKEEEEEEG